MKKSVRILSLLITFTLLLTAVGCSSSGLNTGMSRKNDSGKSADVSKDASQSGDTSLSGTGAAVDETSSSESTAGTAESSFAGTDISSSSADNNSAAASAGTGSAPITGCCRTAIGDVSLDGDICSALPVLSGQKLEKGIRFSAEPGFYDSEFVLGVSSKEDLTIYYTLNGDNPLTSECAFIYRNGITMRDRSTDVNYVSAVSTELFDAANVKVNSSGDGFVTKSSNPSDSAVDKCNVVRAVGIDAAGNATEVITGTWFIGSIEDHIFGITDSCSAGKAAGMSSTLAVISITGDYDDFFDYDRGIYVKGARFDKDLKTVLAAGERLTSDTSRRLEANYNRKGRKNERSIHLEIFEADGSQANSVISQDCGIRIQGNYSRSDLQKGFRLYARNDYGKKNFKYPVFGETLKDENGETVDKFKSLILRNGGNCAFTTKYSADYWAYLAGGTTSGSGSDSTSGIGSGTTSGIGSGTTSGSGSDSTSGICVSTLSSRPAVVYLNGEYWGLYVLEEDYSQDYFADRYGVNKDDVILYKGDAESLALGYKLDLGDLPSPLVPEQYYFVPLLNFFNEHDSLADEAAYREFCRLVDPDSVRDYFAVETWINNKWDWPGKNWSMWRTAGDAEAGGAGTGYGDGRWRFCFYDLEFGGVSGSGDAPVNTIKEDNYKTYGLLDMNTSNPAVLCFAYCMTNEGFREDFYDKLRSLSANEFEKENALRVLNAFSDIYTPLYYDFFNRYPGTGSANDSNNGGYASKKCISDFLNRRSDHIESMIEWCEAILK